MTKRADDILSAAIGDGRAQPLNVAIANAFYECAERMCTDWAELQHPADVLREIADELLNIEIVAELKILDDVNLRITELERRLDAVEYVTDTSSYYD